MLATEMDYNRREGEFLLAKQASEETMRVLQTIQTKLEQHRTNPTAIEPLVDTWERENLGTVYMTSFSRAMTDFMNVHMELGSILRSSDPAVPPTDHNTPVIFASDWKNHT